ncbi:MAG: hypothetical protein H0T39_12585 [Actinobacteria bacterium]|nr:hypothetical protein [Actinomycetota bacterium]
MVNPRILYRIVKTNPPTLEDFTSNAARGQPFTHPDPSRRRLWSGLSFHGTEAQARRNARRYRTHGSYIAAVEVEDGAPIRVERTLGPGHYTVWGEPSALLGRCVGVASVG